MFSIYEIEMMCLSFAVLSGVMLITINNILDAKYFEAHKVILVSLNILFVSILIICASFLFIMWELYV